MNTPPLRLARLHHPVTALGPGTRLALWTQGCPLACNGCMSRDTWNPDAGTDTTPEQLADAWDTAQHHGATGLTVSGGEPLTQPHALAAALHALTARHHPATRPDILLYTGYEPPEIDHLTRTDPAVAHCLAHTDALITGRYDATRPTDLIWRGSANQHLIPLTPLGRHRYAPHLTHAPPRPPIQVGVDDEGLWLIGVPRRGQLAHFTRALRHHHIALEGVSWRPPPSTAAG